MKKIKRIVLSIFVLMFFVLGSYVVYDLLKENSLFPQTIHISSADEVINKKLSLETTIFENFESKKELITFEAELSDIVEWDESWGTFGVFHKSQKIRFYGTGLYIADMNLVMQNDLQADLEQKTLTVALPKPVVKTVTINDNMTEYESVQKGWLRFGEIDLTPEQYNTMYSAVKQNMQNALESEELLEKAEKSTLNSVKEIFQSIVDVLEDDYTVQIIWKTT